MNDFLHYVLEKISFIDFEYVGYNYLAFDIANHFCEYAGKHIPKVIFVVVVVVVAQQLFSSRPLTSAIQV